MATIDPGEIKLFRYADQLPEDLWRDLQKRPPEEAAAATDSQWDGRCFHVPVLGRQYLVDPNACTIKEAERPDARPRYETGLVLVANLANAMDVPLSGRMVTPMELPSGGFFFTGPHELPTAPIEQRFAHDLEGLKEAAAAMSPEPWQGADVALRIAGLPRVPLYLLFWGADEEFGARAVYGVDDRTHMYMALDVLWALFLVLMRRLLGKDA